MQKSNKYLRLAKKVMVKVAAHFVVRWIINLISEAVIYAHGRKEICTITSSASRSHRINGSSFQQPSAKYLVEH